MRLNTVVLPAPFGPKSPSSSPASTSRSTPRTACTPLKRLSSPLASSTRISALRLRRRAARGFAPAQRHARKRRGDAVAHEEDHGEQQKADDGEVKAGRDDLQDLADADIEDGAEDGAGGGGDA